MQTERYKDAHPHQRASDMEVNGPFGTRIKVSGKEAVNVLMVSCAVAAVGYMLYVHDHAAAEVQKENAAALKAVSEKQEQLGRSMEEVVYVLSLTEQERSKLNLSMPESLRYKVQSRRNQ